MQYISEFKYVVLITIFWVIVKGSIWTEKKKLKSVQAQNLFHIFTSQDAFLNLMTYMYVLVMECQIFYGIIYSKKYMLRGDSYP